MLKHIALCKHGLDPEPYNWHAHLLGVWDTYPSSIVARLPRVAPTSGSADSADAAELAAHGCRRRAAADGCRARLLP